MYYLPYDNDEKVTIQYFFFLGHQNDWLMFKNLFIKINYKKKHLTYYFIEKITTKIEYSIIVYSVKQQLYTVMLMYCKEN